MKQAYYNNHRHGSRLLSPLRPGDKVLSKLDHQKLWALPKVISGESITPRSYILRTQNGDMLRQNRRHLQPGPPYDPAAAQPVNVQTPPVMDSQPPTSAQAGAGSASQTAATADPPLSDQTVTRSVRVSRPVQRLNL